MRKRFEDQLNELSRMVTKMGELLEEATSLAVDAMKNHDQEAAKQAIHYDIEIDEMEKETESLCLRLLMQQQPVARDLRTVSAALKIITDMERVGDHASDIAENIIYMTNNEKDDYSRHLPNILKMADVSLAMVKDSVRAFVQRDLELAVDVLVRDDQVDDLFMTVKTELIEVLQKDASFGEMAIDLMMIAKYFERIGDHAENIAEWVEFAITGIHRKHQAGA